MRPNAIFCAFAASIALGACGSIIPGTFEEGPTEGPLTADGLCPTFQERYPRCEVQFGNRGLSTLNSFYETFIGEGAFEVDGFTVDTLGEDRFVITAQSNRGPITSQIFADRIVRLGQEREDEQVNRTISPPSATRDASTSIRWATRTGTCTCRTSSSGMRTATCGSGCSKGARRPPTSGVKATAREGVFRRLPSFDASLRLPRQRSRGRRAERRDATDRGGRAS